PNAGVTNRQRRVDHAPGRLSQGVGVDIAPPGVQQFLVAVVVLAGRETLEPGVRAKAIKAKQEPTAHVVAVRRFARRRRRERLREVDAQVGFLDHVEQSGHRPASAKFALDRSQAWRLWLRFEGSDDDGMAATRVEANAGIARHSVVERAQSVSQFRAQALYEVTRLHGQAEAFVTSRATVGKVGRQIFVGIAETVGPRDPNLLTTQPLAQSLQDTNLIIDSIDALSAVRRILDDDVAPFGTDDAFDGDFGGLEVLASVALGATDRVQGVEQGTMSAVVGAKLQRRQQPGHHATVVGTVRSAHRGMHTPAPRRSKR